jgi:hypothetical protein
MIITSRYVKISATAEFSTAQTTRAVDIPTVAEFQTVEAKGPQDHNQD